MKTNQYLLREVMSIVLKLLNVSIEMMIGAPTLFILSEGCGTIGINDTAFELSFGYLLLTLGFKPIGVESRNLHYSQQLKGELAGVSIFEEWDSNKVHMLQPDIIVALDYFRPEQLQ